LAPAPPNNVPEEAVNLTIHPVLEKHNRSGSFKGYTLTGWDHEEGWLISFSSTGRDSVTTIWVDGSFDSPCFYSISPIELDARQVIEIDCKPVELTLEEKEAVLGTIWDWEVWESVKAAGTCMIESLVRMLDLPRDVVLHWFRIAGRNPSFQDDVFKTLEENGYTVHVAGPEGLGQFYNHRRLVFMFTKEDSRKGRTRGIYCSFQILSHMLLTFPFFRVWSQSRAASFASISANT
jgi:hypothetical protein